MKKFIPSFHAPSIYEVDPRFFKHLGITTLLVDLDNTLASYREEAASVKTKQLIALLASEGIKVFLLSNNKEARVKKYAATLDLPYLSSARKPLRGRIHRFMATHKLNKEETMMVGDQLLTDVYGANRLGVKILLVEQLVTEDQWTTRFNRLVDRPLRRRLQRKNLLREWTTYGE